MCAEAPPIKALSYLQTEVSAVVDHSDPDETSLFRSLLAYLLAPPDGDDVAGEGHAPTRLEPPPRSTSPGQLSPMKVDPTDKTSEMHTEDTDESMGEEAAVEHSLITSDADDEADPAPTKTGRQPVVSMEEDPIEAGIAGGRAPSAKRYEERTAVFEQLMVYVNEDAKQPDKDLLAMSME